MNIRSITYLLDPGWPLDDEALDKAGRFIAAARPLFEKGGYAVQTARLATVPFPRLLASQTQEHALELAHSLYHAAAARGYDYLSLGPALPDFPDSYRLIPRILQETQNVFAAGVIADTVRGVSLQAARACAEVIHAAAPLDPNGFANLYFAALANVPPGGPFFPAAYHDGGPPLFALALEAADLAVEAFTEKKKLSEARDHLRLAVERHGKTLTSLSQELAADFSLPFGGLDFSMAPFPEAARSLGTAMEAMGVPAVGLHGSLAASAILADTIDRAVFPRAGFSGLFLPVLEDSVLAARAEEGTLNLNDLLLYAAVCGAGLDTIPLPGDTTVDQLTALLLDVAALSLRLNKPLTARLMPIPGKAAGDPTSFDFAYFSNSRVLDLRAGQLKNHLAGQADVKLSRRN